jgi:hypothetical protein
MIFEKYQAHLIRRKSCLERPCVLLPGKQHFVLICGSLQNLAEYKTQKDKHDQN